MSPEMTVLLFLNLQVLTTVNEPSSETGKKAKVGEGGHSPFGMDPVQGQRGCGEGMEPSKGGGDPDPGFVRMGGRSLENLLLDGFGKADERLIRLEKGLLDGGRDHRSPEDVLPHLRGGREGGDGRCGHRFQETEQA
jgi:hypothetical protein